MIHTSPATLAKHPRTVIVYVTDRGFALPSAASALEVRRLVPCGVADISIVTVGIPQRNVDLLSSYLHPHNIAVTILPSRTFSNIDREHFNQTHVPDTSLARFFITEALPCKYDRILYLDGDVWPSGDLSELMSYQIPPGCLAAAEDQSFFYQNDFGATGRAVRAYFAGLGINGSDGYFNNGVLFADVTTWKILAREAFQFFSENIRICRYHDQSALNAVVSGRRVRMSPRWNFLSVYRNWDVAPLSQAHLIHFAGGIKPWAVPDPEFDGLYDKYKAYFQRLDVTELNVEACSRYKIEESIAHNARIRRKMKTTFLYRKWMRRSKFLEMERTSLLK